MVSRPNPLFEEVVIVGSYETESKDGDKTIHATLLDGTILLLTKPNPTKLEKLKQAKSAETLQEDYADWLRRQLDRASTIGLNNGL